MACWLMKTEPDVYGVDDLRRDRRTGWEGVRNYQVRNWFRDAVRAGDRVLIYHSNAEPPGVVGLGEIVREAYPDPFALDPGSKYFDPKATAEANPWLSVDVGFVEAWAAPVTLAELKADPALVGMEVTKKGTRLSVTPVEPAHFDHVVALGRAKGPVAR
jgi:predicted RNA-binding protein with PUA-like domain